MLKKRIIPCLDVQNGRAVKGVNFLNIRDAGDPIERAKLYSDQGADELVFLDISATIEKRKTLLKMVERVAKEIRIPFTVGGGIGSVADVSRLISAGADKVSLNSAAIARPDLIAEIAQEFGSQCLTLAIDTKKVNSRWLVFTQGGRKETPLHTRDWAKRGVQLGAGEILLTSMNNDGTKEGFALDITQEVCEAVQVPVIASGGAGSITDFAELFSKTRATGGLAASIFHYNEISIPSLKHELQNQNIPVR